MPIEILMPALSPTMEEGTLAKWLVSEGDSVQSGDLLAEIETDKATMEFESVDEGTVGKLVVSEGSQNVRVNSVIAILLTDGESADDIGEVADEKPADQPEQTEKPASGAEATAEQGKQEKPNSKTSGERIFATPLARRIAGDRDLDLSQIKGSGPRGRIIKADVEGAVAGATRPAAKPEAQASAPSDQPNDVVARYEDRGFTELKLDGMRKTIAARLTEAKQTIPHFYLRRDIMLDPLLKLRAEVNEQLAKREIKLSVNDYIIKACALALQQVPDANAVWAGDRILRITPSDVAVAVAVEGGLFTPVIKDAHIKTLSAISAEMKDLASRARGKKLMPEEYQGGSFAISNLGMFGIDNFDAVINPPHGSILAVGAGARKPVVGADGELSVATVMSVTLSVDHRVIDGALGAEFLQAIKDHLENPMLMLA